MHSLSPRGRGEVLFEDIESFLSESKNKLSVYPNSTTMHPLSPRGRGPGRGGYIKTIEGSENNNLKLSTKN
jgi:hypothetical protein